MSDPSGDGRSNRERMLAGDPYIPEDPDNHRRHLNPLKLTADFINGSPQDEAALDAATISIGADCQFGPNVQLLTASHPIDPVARREKWETCKPIRIGDTCGSEPERSSWRTSHHWR
jgi:maltose O-acetyltransferase